ncbi:hypothetical protein PSTG_01516 [Puccinia striiformis f. sp. tritici PST-78]|uniref:Uncharacterized protein n=1 Tax=Puccinia striiformis f. sp. tritici PST-78 TaxID=1165861 RepID=A0A0L0W1F1_9BASI|nr:hypothetical protein PSTG_01516 [Puccinia striiformis f. sp. tritici PST-78]
MSNTIYPYINATPAKDQPAASTEFGSNRTDHMLDLQGLTKSLTKPEGVLADHQNNQLTSVITTKLEPSVQMNIANHTNKDNARLLWSDIKEYFASKQPANKARIHQELRAIIFDISDVPKFITEVKIVLNKMYEVGIDTTDNVCYDILNKLPESMSNMTKHITHSEKKLTT